MSIGATPGGPTQGAPLVAIIGGGCAGTLVAANLLRQPGAPLRIVIIERSGRFGPGIAYATEDPQHLLNVPAERMSSLCDEPMHFAEWASRRLGSLAPGSYLPRRLYGEYLSELLLDSAARGLPRRALELISGEVVALRRDGARLELALAGGASLACDHAVLATGAARHSAWPCAPDDPRVVDEPWAAGALRPPRRRALAIVLGTGLSGVDAALSLTSAGSNVLMLSRGGEFPATSLPGLRAPAPPPLVPRVSTLAALERRLRQHTRSMQRAGYDWRDVMEGLRPVTPQLWGALSSADRRHFLRVRRRAWDAHRHRMAPVAGARIHELLERAQVLARQVGTMLAVRPEGSSLEVDLALRGATRARTVTCARVVVCTGPGADIRRSGSALLDSLLSDGTASPDALALGLRTTPAGSLVNSRGECERQIHTLGAMRRGELWETTAVAEIRTQAERLARSIEVALERPAQRIASSFDGVALRHHARAHDMAFSPIAMSGHDATEVAQ